MMATLCFLLIASFQLAFSNPLSQVFGALNIETPSYDIVMKGANYEVRRYHSQLWAQIDFTVDPSTDFGNKMSIGFQPLFQYITGKNAAGQKIPMTAPVIMQRLDSEYGRRRMSFIMSPSKFSTLDQLPKPINVNVKLVAVTDPVVLACIRFNMGLTSKRVGEREEELRKATATDRIQLVNERALVRVASYNPPWTLPWFRTNDICIPLVNQA
ncbi:unnamed protein product [Rotaria socialis]|nr:unnamed protein product [Rotaria socialis]